MTSDPFEARLMFRTRSLHTAVKPCPPAIAGAVACRVCGVVLELGAPIRARQWHLEYAHEACGWFRPDEGALREARRPGTSFAYFEWRCPSCELDACAGRRPADGGDMRCARCIAELPAGAGRPSST